MNIFSIPFWNWTKRPQTMVMQMVLDNVLWLGLLEAGGETPWNPPAERLSADGHSSRLRSTMEALFAPGWRKPVMFQSKRELSGSFEGHLWRDHKPENSAKCINHTTNKVPSKSPDFYHDFFLKCIIIIIIKVSKLQTISGHATQSEESEDSKTFLCVKAPLHPFPICGCFKADGYL